MPRVPISLPQKGLPWPFILTPKTDQEARCGKATLIVQSDIETIIAGIKAVAPEREDLIQKFSELLGA